MSNGREIGTIVGTLVAAYFTAGTSYAAFAVAAGGAVGGYIGGQIDPDKVYGPRLDDLKVIVSTYGASIPRIYGTVRTGGIVIWSTDRQEVVTEEDQGKGGSGVESTTYNYYVHMRVLLCEKTDIPVDLVKVFQDGKLVWDATSGLTLGQALATEASPLSSAQLYQGEDTQTPDPYEEQFLGAGEADAYRDYVSISLRYIECPGGRVPQFSFVLSNTSTIGDESFDFCDNIGYAATIMPDRLYSFSQNVNTTSVYLGVDGALTKQRDISMPSN